MIKVNGRIATFTGKERKWLMSESKRLGLSPQNFFTAKMWQFILSLAEEGAFNEKA